MKIHPVRAELFHGDRPTDGQTHMTKLTFRSDIPVVLCKLNTEYITSSRNTTKFIVLCCTICNTTTCFGPFLGHLQVIYYIVIWYSILVIRVHYSQG